MSQGWSSETRQSPKIVVREEEAVNERCSETVGFFWGNGGNGNREQKNKEPMS